MQSDHKTLGVSYGVLIILGTAVLLFTVSMLLNVPSLVQTSHTGDNDPAPSAIPSRANETATAPNQTRAAQQLVQYRQRIAILSEQVTRYQKEIESLSRTPESNPVAPRSASGRTASPDGGSGSGSTPAAGSQLASVTSQLDAAQDAQADLLSENIRLQRKLDDMADDLALLEEVNQSIQDDTTRQRRISIETAAATLSRVDESPIPYLIECLDDADMEVQIWGASVLAELGPDASDALPALQQMLLVDDASVRMAVAAAIDAIEGE